MSSAQRDTVPIPATGPPRLNVVRLAQVVADEALHAPDPVGVGGHKNALISGKPLLALFSRLRDPDWPQAGVVDVSVLPFALVDVTRLVPARAARLELLPRHIDRPEAAFGP